MQYIMTANPENFRPRESGGSQQYLDSSIRTASPAKLRLMMIERGVEVAGILAHFWRTNDVAGSNEHSLKLLDLLTELLSGVTGGSTEDENAVCLKVADLYVFLVQHLLAAEQHGDASFVDEIRLVLETEAETWRAVCANQGAAARTTPHFARTAESASVGLNFEA